MAAALRTALDWTKALADLLYPPVCPLCYRRLGREDRTVCGVCESQLYLKWPDWECPRCGAVAMGSPPAPGNRCRLCPPADSAYQGVLSVCGYSDYAARCVHLFKYNRRPEMGKLMARLMVEHLAERLGKLTGRIHAVAPVPLHPLRRMTRGFNQSQLLAAPLAAMLDLPLSPRLLRRVKHTRRQALIPRDRRAENVKGAFALRPTLRAQVAGQGILLIDDVVTSGHTINECARVLKEAGAREIWVASFARAGMGRSGDEE